MRIALDATYSAGDHLSGVGVYSRELLHGLAASQPGRFLWCYRPHRFLRSFRHPLPSRSYRRLLLESWAPVCDLFHGLNQRLPRARLSRSVVTFHDLFVLTAEYSTAEFRRRFAEQAREAADRADRIIAVSRFTASQVSRLLGVDSERIDVIHHGVVPRPAASGERQPIVLSVGALQKRKNTARLVDAFSSAPRGWKLVLAGAQGYGSESILCRVEASPRRTDIILAGYVDDRELAHLYASASIFAFPSLDEGFGMPILEAMSVGLPVITSNRSAMPEVAGDAATLVDPESTEELREALNRLATNESLRQQLSKRGHERAKQFRWEDAVEKTWRVYQLVLRGKS